MIAAGANAAELERGLVGRRSGIISSLRLVEGIDGDAPLYFAAARIAQTHRTPGFDGQDCAGCGKTVDQAKIAALAEGVERYCAGSYRLESLERQAQRDLQGDSINPMDFAQFSAAQRRRGFALATIGRHLPIRWIRGQWLGDGRPVWVPASACFLPWAGGDEPPVAPGTSTGLAAGESFAAAVDRAIGEIVERDAISLTWLKGVTPPRVSPALVKEVAGDLLPPADQVDVFDMTSDLGLPVFVAICRGPGPWGLLVSAGSACDRDPALALRRAATEASLTRVYVRQLVAQDPTWKLEGRFVNVDTFSRHARLYSQRPQLTAEAMAFLHGGPLVDRLPESGPGPEDSLRRAGMHAAVLDLTQPWSAGLGIHVARVLAPALFPLHATHTLPFLGHCRLADAGRALPRGRIRHGYNLWPYPHPFP
ncbi:MAG: YcaO-like family protein [Tepidisphaeraceae bacterium]|jgi:ribosomal protein S12 methylthiotransferase accessory factor